ncbi:type II toxin-antitoxin system prevent-host-death family antitoxin [Lactiplantibacillus songbeiensis]|uniref:Antitoxin n=1 Tax=Lactiplantibacillus songbeiensis TaxID=2559920 RepID=A0ABW4C3S9_9LACO|nr:type II toxin-antitoxin system prevent-host-death family antitoxin [Lactiplantibacillus songbeiensis]
MINIKPVSELRDYNKILKEVAPNKPVFLTKNGYGKYAVVDLDEYEKMKAGLELLSQLKQAEKGPFYDFNTISKELLS